MSYGALVQHKISPLTCKQNLIIYGITSFSVTIYSWYKPDQCYSLWGEKNVKLSKTNILNLYAELMPCIVCNTSYFYFIHSVVQRTGLANNLSSFIFVFLFQASPPLSLSLSVSLCLSFSIYITSRKSEYGQRKIK